MHERILLLQLKRIGDAILLAPATALLREHFPAAHLSLVVAGAAGELAGAFSAVDEVFCYRPGRMNLGIWSAIIGGRFDLCLDFSGNDRSALMSRLSRARERVGYRKFVGAKQFRKGAFTRLCDASVRNLHTVDFHCALVRTAAADQVALDAGRLAMGSGFLLPGAAKAVGGQLRADCGGRYAVIHPGTARAEKFWPPERWARVITHLHRAHRMSCILTGSLADPLEAEHLRAITAQSQVPPRNLAGQLTLLEVAAAIGDSTIALGVDSAAMHLAAMLGSRQVVLFGPTNPFHWRPRHENATILIAGDNSLNVRIFHSNHRPRAMMDLSTDHVCRAIDASLAAV